MNKIKSITLIVLSMIFMILLFAPVASPVWELPGLWSEGKYGLTCTCPIFIIWNCYCYVVAI